MASFSHRVGLGGSCCEALPCLLRSGKKKVIARAGRQAGIVGFITLRSKKCVIPDDIALQQRLGHSVSKQTLLSTSLLHMSGKQLCYGILTLFRILKNILRNPMWSRLELADHSVTQQNTYARMCVCR